MRLSRPVPDLICVTSQLLVEKSIAQRSLELTLVLTAT